MELNVKVLAASLAATLNLILIVLVTLRNRKHIVYRSFILISFCLLFWNLRVIISDLSGPTGTDSLYEILITQIFYPMVTACLYILPVAALQFTISIIAIDSKLLQDLVRTAYITALIMSVIFASRIFSTWLYDRLLWLFILPLFVLSLFLIGRAFIHSRRPLEKTRFGLLLAAGTIGVTGAISEDILFASGIDVGGLNSISNATYSFIVAICLLRHRLIDVAVTSRRLVGLVLPASLLILASYLISEFFNLSKTMPYGYILIAVLLLVTLGHRIVPYMEKFLFKITGSAYQTIDGVRNALDRSRNMSDLLRIAGEIAADTLGTSSCLCVARDEVTKQFTLYYSSDQKGVDTLQSDAFRNLAQWLDKSGSRQPFVYDEVCHNLRFDNNSDAHKVKMAQVIDGMQTVGYEVYVPLMIDNELRGIVCLGNKENGRAFTESDIRFVKVIAHSCTLQMQHLKMSERIRQLETLAALGEMSAYIAHEVKNPLAIIRSSAQLVRSKHRNEQAFNIIIDECDRLNRVVTRMLDFSKTPQPNPQSIDIEKEIKKWSRDIVKSYKQQRIHLHVECPSHMPNVIFDPDHLKQVITNLLLNALEAMHGRGRLDISLSKSNGKIRLVIRDSGPGVTHRDLGNIFHPFYTTKPGGSGLGLPITRRLLELNNGTIEIRPKVGKGCVVVLDLPLWSD